MSNHQTNSVPVIIAAIVTIFFAAVSGQGPAMAPAPAPVSYTGQAPSSPGPTTSYGPTAASAPGPGGVDCMTNLLNMSDCLSYVTENSNVTVPDPNCCPEVAGIVESSPQCLCLLFGNTTNSYGISIDLKRALKLPSVCKVKTPDVSACALYGYPVPGPVSNEGDSPGMAPGGMAPGGFAASPTTGNNENGASGIAATSAKGACFAAFALTLLLTFF